MKTKIFSASNIRNISYRTFCIVLIFAFAVGLTACSSNPDITVGDVIQFGGNDWRVLEVKGDNALILSDGILFSMPYQVPPEGEIFVPIHTTEITWEECDLRQYLNSEFYDTTFSADEKQRIIDTTLKNDKNPWYGIEGGYDTKDKVFLLSLDEVIQYFGSSEETAVENWQNDTFIDDQFNKARIAKTSEGAATMWWLRSPGGNYYCGKDHIILAATVTNNGGLCIQGDYVSNGYVGVRPALWLKV